MSEQIPEGWSIKSIGSVFERISNGTTANQIDTEDGVAVTRIETISDGVINFSKVGRINYLDADERYLMKRGDILFSNINSVKHIGKVAFYNGEKKLFHGMNLLLFRADEKTAHNKFLFNLIRSDDFICEISKRVKPAINQASISGGDLKEIEFLSPPLPEQKKIASILTSVDEVIEKTQSQIDKLQDLKKGTMNELLTKGIGHTEFKDSELGRIPKSWEVRTLSEVAKVVDCKHRTPTYREEGFPVVRPRDVKFSGIDFEQCVLVDEVDFNDLNENHKPSVGDTIYSRNATFGIGSYVKYSHDFAIGQDVCIISPKNMHPRFLNLYLNSDIVFSQVLNEMSGSTFKRINLGSIKNFKIAVPEYEEQEKLANMISAAISSIHQNEKKQQKYISLKKSLMQDLLTGKVRVSVN